MQATIYFLGPTIGRQVIPSGERYIAECILDGQDTNEHWSLIMEWIDEENETYYFEPGRVKNANIQYVSEEAPVEQLRKKKYFYIYEGLQCVALGILKPEEDNTHVNPGT